jgi:uncharacterized protein (DUF433 family)
MTATILNISEIVSDPKIRGGRPVIAGTGLTVINIALTHTTGDKLSEQEIAQHYGLNLGRIYAALAYYYLHQVELDEEIQQERDETQHLTAELQRQGKLTHLE